MSLVNHCFEADDYLRPSKPIGSIDEELPNFGEDVVIIVCSTDPRNPVQMRSHPRQGIPYSKPLKHFAYFKMPQDFEYPAALPSLYSKNVLIISNASRDSSEISEVNNALDHWEQLCKVGEVNTAVDMCFELIENAFLERNLFTVQKLLDEANPDKLDSRVTVGMLRASFRAKDHLGPSWTSLLAKERRRLQGQGRNDKRILRGLVSGNAESFISAQSAA
jgi:hypothetical protein